MTMADPNGHLECIGADGHGGCGWRGHEDAADCQPCRFLLNAEGLIAGFERDPAGVDDVWICPACGGECSHVPAGLRLPGEGVQGE
jgi:hypothetical protein